LHDMKTKILSESKRLEKLTFNQQRMLISLYSKSLKEIKAKLADFVEKLGDKPSIVEANKYNRLKNLEVEISKEIMRLAQSANGTITGAVRDSYKESFQIAQYAAETSVNVTLGLLDRPSINNAITNPLTSIKWQDRTKINHQLYANNVRDEITKGLIQGKGYGKIAKALNKRTKSAALSSVRIINTETHRAQQQGINDVFNELDSKSGIEVEKQWIATLDEKTRISHQQLDQKYAAKAKGFDNPVFAGVDESGSLVYGEAPGLFGVPAMDINCRCTEVISVKGIDEPAQRKARERGTNKVVKNMSYEEWTKSRGIKTKLGGK